MTKINVVIFDLDDTLVSEKEYIQSGFMHISKLLSNKTSMNQSEIFSLLNNLFNENSENVFNRFYEFVNYEYSEKDIIHLVYEYRNHFPNLSLYTDVLPCMDYLKKNGIKTGIITDGYKESQQQKIKAIKANEYIDKMIITDQLGREYWKPHPKSFEILKEYFNVDYNEIMYVGDNPTKDFYISSIYPITTVRIKRENGVYVNSKYFKGIKERITISSLTEIIKILKIEDWRTGEKNYGQQL